MVNEKKNKANERGLSKNRTTLQPRTPPYGKGLREHPVRALISCEQFAKGLADFKKETAKTLHTLEGGQAMKLSSLYARVKNHSQPSSEAERLWRYLKHTRFTVTLRHDKTGEQIRFRRRDGYETKAFRMNQRPRRILMKDRLRIERAIKDTEAAQR